MDTKDLRTLKIFEKVEQNCLPSQRDLARDLNISLGLVNSFVRRLAQKGYFKVANIPKNRIKYILTPRGAAEKTRLTYQYIQYSYQFYKNARQKLKNLFSALERQGVDSIVFYGAGDLAEIAYLSLQETSIQLAAVVDDINIGKKIAGLIVRDASELDSMAFNKILITAVNSRNRILKKLVQMKIAPERIVEIH